MLKRTPFCSAILIHIVDTLYSVSVSPHGSVTYHIVTCCSSHNKQMPDLMAVELIGSEQLQCKAHLTHPDIKFAREHALGKP